MRNLGFLYQVLSAEDFCRFLVGFSFTVNGKRKPTRNGNRQKSEKNLLRIETAKVFAMFQLNVVLALRKTHH